MKLAVSKLLCNFLFALECVCVCVWVCEAKCKQEMINQQLVCSVIIGG